jgi:hypothetical protein
MLGALVISTMFEYEPRDSLLHDRRPPDSRSGGSCYCYLLIIYHDEYITIEDDEYITIENDDTSAFLIQSLVVSNIRSLKALTLTGRRLARNKICRENV